MNDNVKKYTKRTACVIIFILLMVFMLVYLNQVLIIKRVDGVVSMKALYAQEDDTIDVLFVGSSHAGVNVDPEELWTNYGISSFTLWAGMQPLWNTYYNLIEAFKTQSPEVVVLEVFACTFNFDYSDDARQVMSVGGMKLSKNKLEACKASAKKDKQWDLFFSLPFYHSRINELTKNDFEYFSWNKDIKNCKGSGVRYPSRNEGVLTNPENITTIGTIHEKEEEYLLKIIELCESRSQKLLLVKTPSANRDIEQPFYNRVAKIAQEHSLEFLNLNIMDDETGITVSDYWDDYDYHMNTRGARKVSNYLGQVLTEKYDLIDHRGDARYLSWDRNATQLQNEYLTYISSSNDYFKELKRDGRSVFIVKNGNWNVSSEFINLLLALQTIATNSSELATPESCAWFMENSSQSSNLEKKTVDATSSFEFDSSSFAVDYLAKKVMINGKTVCTLSESGLVCVVYDENINECVDVSVFTPNEAFRLRHISEWKD